MLKVKRIRGTFDIGCTDLEKGQASEFTLRIDVAQNIDLSEAGAVLKAEVEKQLAGFAGTDVVESLKAELAAAKAKVTELQAKARDVERVPAPPPVEPPKPRRGRPPKRDSE